MEERNFSGKIMGRNGGIFIAMFDYRRKNAMDGSSHVFPATQNNNFLRGVHLHSQLPQHRKWLCQPMACRHMVAEAEAIRGLHLANHWPVSKGGSPELGHLHRTWFPISCLIFRSHITRIASVWSQPIQPEGMDNFQTCLSVSMLVAMATETFSSGKNPTMLW